MENGATVHPLAEEAGGFEQGVMKPVGSFMG